MPVRRPRYLDVRLQARIYQPGQIKWESMRVSPGFRSINNGLLLLIAIFLMTLSVVDGIQWWVKAREVHSGEIKDEVSHQLLRVSFLGNEIPLGIEFILIGAFFLMCLSNFLRKSNDQNSDIE